MSNKKTPTNEDSCAYCGIKEGQKIRVPGGGVAIAHLREDGNDDWICGHCKFKLLKIKTSLYK